MGQISPILMTSYSPLFNHSKQECFEFKRILHICQEMWYHSHGSAWGWGWKVDPVLEGRSGVGSYYRMWRLACGGEGECWMQM